ncbi:N-acetylmuramoyl-L-alanine amidase [Synergistales bacterium]|nr:N-acetylmuramoyl-L-alanine amidase [Synergistales bacterium]
MKTYKEWGCAFRKALLSLLILLIATEVSAATLFIGDSALGEVPAINGPDGLRVSLSDTGALLGMNASVVGEELVLSIGNDKLRVVLNAFAAWHNSQLIPLLAAADVQNGRWWLDTRSALSLFQRVAGNGKKLRIEGTASKPQKVSQPKAAEPKAESQPPQRVTVVSTPMTPKLAPTPVPATAPTPAAAATPSSSAQTPPTPEKPGELRAVRWSTSKEKIRAVMDCTEGTNPDINLQSGKVAMNFVRTQDNVQGVPSPYDEVKVELVKNKDSSFSLLFSAAGVRVEKLVLDNPRRIVLDFVFNTPTVVKEPVKPKDSGNAAAVAATAGSGGRDGAPGKKGKMLVVVDAGHGGNDPGAIGNGIKEKDINLAIALKMEKSLQAKGFNVKLTRRTDVYLKLQERTDIANEAGADMFVSIHVNALPPGKNSYGFEIYLMALPTDKDALALAKIENREYIEDKGSAASDRKTELLLRILGDMQQNNKINESTIAAERLLEEGKKMGLIMRHVKQAPFFVLRGTGMPAVLLETGFVTNVNDAKLLANARYQQTIADAMSNGVYSYLTQ